MDCVEGKKKTKKTLLVLTERLTRREIIVLMKDKTAESVVKALDRLERRTGKMFYKIFQTITVDNGSEFADYEGMERARYRKGKRTRVYYCHPYSSYERGANENQNKMVRRRYPKGTDFTPVSDKDICALEDWVNGYPRGIFDYGTAAEAFEKCVAELRQKIKSNIFAFTIDIFISVDLYKKSLKLWIEYSILNAIAPNQQLKRNSNKWTRKS